MVLPVDGVLCSASYVLYIVFLSWYILHRSVDLLAWPFILNVISQLIIFAWFIVGMHALSSSLVRLCCILYVWSSDIYSQLTPLI